MPPDTLAAALVAFQADAPALQRDAINPHLNSKYLSLEALMEGVLPVLTTHGLALAQFPTTISDGDGKHAPALRTRLYHASGEYVEDVMPLLLDKQTSQAQGSAITYGRRYAAMAMLGLSADKDDDGGKPKRETTKRNPGKITAKQRGEIFEAVRAKSMATDRAREIVKSVADVDDTADIPAAMFRDVLKAIKDAA